MNIQEIRKHYPMYDDLSDKELADKLHSKFYSDMDLSDFYDKFGINNESSKKSNLLSSLKNAYSEFTPDQPNIGMNVASGLLSLSGKSPQQKNLIRNLPQVLQKRNPYLSEELAQGFGEYLPVTLSGIGSVPGLLGAASRIGAAGIYGGLENKENPISGVQSGITLGMVGEALPGALHIAGKLAEKINPIKFAKQKINELKDYYKDTLSRQKESYSYYEPYKKEEISINPKSLFTKEEKKYFTPKINEKLQILLKDKNIENAHKLQSQMFSTSNLIKESGAEDIATKEAIENSRNKLNELISKKLKSLDSHAADMYQMGRDITREELKPLLETRKLRTLLKGKKENYSPSGLEKVLREAFEKETSKIPETHKLKEILDDLQIKLKPHGLMKDIVPEYIRKFSPKFAKLAQNPDILEALKRSEYGMYRPLQASLTGKILQE